MNKNANVYEIFDGCFLIKKFFESKKGKNP